MEANDSQLLRSAEAKLRQARQNIEQFEALVEKYLNDEPIVFLGEPSEDESSMVWKYKRIKTPPEDINFRASEALAAMRSALDICGAATAAIQKDKPKNTYFPFGETEKKARERQKGNCKDIPDGIFEEMMKARPYEGGDNELWAFGQLSNMDKHVDLLDVSAGMIRQPRMINATHVVNFSLPLRWDLAKGEMIYVTLKPEGNLFSVETAGMFVCFSNYQKHFDNRTACSVLNSLHKKIEAIVASIKQRALDDGIFTV
jgi:hypothetical protein